MAKIAIVIEDDHIVREYLKILLHRRGYAPRVFESFNEAIAQIRSIPNFDSVQLIISDFEVEGDLFDGIKFLEALEDFFINAKRILFSARDDIRSQVLGKGWNFVQKSTPGWLEKLKSHL